MDILEAIHTRRSIRKYTNEPVAEDDLRKVLGAAMTAPSAGNAQPWRFVVVTDRGLLNRLMAVHQHLKMLETAPMAIMVCGDPSLEKYPGYWPVDCAAAVENLLLAAHGIGLGTVWTGVYPDTERMQKMADILGLPETVIPHTLIPIGHPDQPSAHKDRFDPDRVRFNTWQEAVMEKRTPLGAVNALYPSLTVLAGTVVDGKANFNTIAHVGILNHGTPQYLSLGMNKMHHTGKGIREHGEFSINIPDRSMVELTDYCGLVSGRNVDKSALFELEYGELAHAPLIAACPVSMEMRLKEILDYDRHDIIIGEVVQTWARDSVLTDGKIDCAKVDPLLFDMPGPHYWALGQRVAKCWDAGKKLKK